MYMKTNPNLSNLALLYLHMTFKSTLRNSTKFELNKNNAINPILVLRMVTTIVFAHTFCASRDTRISYRRCLLIQGYFCVVQNYAEKAELSKCTWYPKRKLGVTMHFSEKIKLQFGKEHNTFLCILKLCAIIVEDVYILRGSLTDKT